MTKHLTTGSEIVGVISFVRGEVYAEYDEDCSEKRLSFMSACRRDYHLLAVMLGVKFSIHQQSLTD